ncbi:MAG: protein-methionine-sulfoxide reductase catalytic subunit MsrP [Candidatus Lambdaproteobacteria bacterium]|nr:protein-methionine-sulfoxide reductase catalytic subunit MsrP [Candidatus Lambdaproteobacteria bacterium]
MAHHHRRRGWELSAREVTPEPLFLDRRRFLAAMGLGVLTAAGLASGAEAASLATFKQTFEGLKALKAARNPRFAVAQAPTPEHIPAQYNNFYEFSTDKDDVWELAAALPTDPWRVEVAGLVARPRTFDVDELLRNMALEERIYRFRCVEAWAMVVPWVGFPFKALLDRVQPLSGAKYVRFTTFMEPKVAPRQRPQRWFPVSEPWPYTEGLTMAEAMSELALLTFGSYGHILPKQHGAPIRLIVPWKYGYKNIKSIVKIELTDRQPATFWNTLAPDEYGFESNVDPAVPHPRWSQAFERDIGTRERRPTLYLNGYEAQVGQLYRKA